MNKIDIVNIKNELAKRKTANYKWEDGGEMTKDDIMVHTNNELNELLKNYENAKKNKISEKVHKLVDEIFEKYSNEDDNMIPLSCAYRPEYRLSGDTGIEVYCSVTLSDEDGYNDNPQVKPIARNWYEEDERWENYTDDLAKLVDETSKAKVPYAEDYFDENESINMYWYGVIAITRDYRIVGFIMRDDGSPMKDNELDYPCIMDI
jgi:hypothetical protein